MGAHPAHELLSRYSFGGSEDPVGMRFDGHREDRSYSSSGAEPSESPSRAARPGLARDLVAVEQIPDSGIALIQGNPNVHAFRQERLYDEGVVVVEKEADISRALDTDIRIPQQDIPDLGQHVGGKTVQVAEILRDS